MIARVYSRLAHRRDDNEAKLITFWRAAGCIVFQQPPGQGFDLLVAAPGGTLHIVEVKNPARTWKLTDEERAAKEELERMGCAYNIICTLEQAAALVGR